MYLIKRHQYQDDMFPAYRPFFCLTARRKGEGRFRRSPRVRESLKMTRFCSVGSVKTKETDRIERKQNKQKDAEKKAVPKDIVEVQ